MTLTQTAILTKRILIISGVLIFVGLFSWLGLVFYRASQPKPPIPPPIPTIKFGILPKLLLPESTASATNHSYSLDTDTGDLPKNISTIAKVYVTPQLGATLLAADRVKTTATKFGFSIGPEIVNSSVHRFSSPEGGVMTMTINLDTGNFNFQRIDASPSAETINQNIPDQTLLTQTFKNYLSSKGLLTGTLQSGRMEVKYEDLPAQSAHADISLWPDKLDDLDIVTPTFSSGLVSATFSKYLKFEDPYLSFNYVYWEPDETTSSTYPIKTPQVAFDDLQNNKGVVIIDSKKPQVSITKVYLAYYEPAQYPTYIQPVYVFQGPDFVAYVPAITADLMEK